MFDFLWNYLKNFEFGNTSTPLFLDFLKNYIVKSFGNDDIFNQIDWETWLYKEGFPPKIHDEAFEDENYKRMKKIIEKFI